MNTTVRLSPQVMAPSATSTASARITPHHAWIGPEKPYGRRDPVAPAVSQAPASEQVVVGLVRVVVEVVVGQRLERRERRRVLGRVRVVEDQVVHERGEVVRDVPVRHAVGALVRVGARDAFAKRAQVVTAARAGPDEPGDGEREDEPPHGDPAYGVLRYGNVVLKCRESHAAPRMTGSQAPPTPPKPAP